MPSLKIELSPELAAQLESETLASGISRAKVIAQILNNHYSSEVQTTEGGLLLQEKEAQIRQLEQMINWMYQLNYVLVGTKLLPTGAPKLKKPWLSRLKERLLGH